MVGGHFYFEYETTDGGKKVTLNTSDDIEIQELLNTFKHFLAASGYGFFSDERIEVVTERDQVEQN